MASNDENCPEISENDVKQQEETPKTSKKNLI